MKYLYLVVLSVAFLACNSTQSKKKEVVAKQEVKQEKVMTITQVMEVAESNVGKEVCFKGMVNHVCAHSGKRCILKNAAGDLSMRVEAAGTIKTFNKELMGNDIIVKGTLREKRLDTDFIDNWEKKVQAKEDAEEGGEHCSSEMQNIKEMRDWMKKNNKDYYAVYFVEGNSYELVQ